MMAEAAAKPSFLSIARVDAGFFLRYPKLLLAAVVVVLIPALYVVIYLASVWDPAARTVALAVGIVNLDRGLEYRDQAFNVGRDVVARLQVRPKFGYVDVATEQEARRMVRQGSLAFALIVPADFSSNAIPGAKAGAGKLVVFASEGNSYPGAALARRFAEDLGREVNQSLNEQRWALVLNNAAGSQRSLATLHQAVQQLRLGANELAAGAQQVSHGADGLSGGAGRLDQGVTQLTHGARELGAGLRSMFAQRAHNSELRRLDEGGRTLLDGQAELNQGLLQLQQGAQRLQAGIHDFRNEANDSAFVSTRVVQGLDQLGEGINGLTSGLNAATAAQQKLLGGATQLNTGIGALTNGLRSMNGGLRSTVTQLPEDSQLDDLSRGSASLRDGSVALRSGTHKLTQAAQHLAGSLDFLESSLPASVKTMDGNAQGLANSVQPEVEIAAVVENNGSGFAPNIVPGTLWLGASLAVFMIYLRGLPLFAEQLSPPARLLGKVLLPALIVLLQALLILLAMLWILAIKAHDAMALGLILGVTSLTFLLIVFAFIRALGDAGKALALVLLAVQLSSSGGVLPVVLSGGLFAQISPYMPITWVVKALKASLFGAFDGDWQHPLQWIAVAGAMAALSACFVGRWRFVEPSALRPTLDL